MVQHHFFALLAVVGLSLIATTDPALANLINNGSFEIPVVPSPYQSSGNVDIVVNGAFGVFASFEGRQFIDLVFLAKPFHQLQQLPGKRAPLVAGRVPELLQIVELLVLNGPLEPIF